MINVQFVILTLGQNNPKVDPISSYLLCTYVWITLGIRIHWNHYNGRPRKLGLQTLLEFCSFTTERIISIIPYTTKEIIVHLDSESLRYFDLQYRRLYMYIL